MASLPFFESFQPLLFGFRQLCSHEDAEYYQDTAVRRYPDLTQDAALLKYVKEQRIEGIFFPGDDGRRHVIKPDIEAYLGKDKPRWWLSLYILVDKHNRHHWVTRFPPGKKFADKRELPISVRESLRHESEDGWAKAVTDKHHIMQFPMEILINITTHVVFCPDTVRPNLITTNWNRHFNMFPSCKGFATEYHHAQKEDQYGPLTEIRRVLRMGVDATIMRSCKVFYEIGKDILFSPNTFNFHTVSPTSNGSPPTMILGRIKGKSNSCGYRVFRPAPTKPAQSDPDTSNEISDGTQQILAQVPMSRLKGWITYDPLLRFIHKIGVRSSADIHAIELEGALKLHECDNSHWRCKDGLSKTLTFYVPFIRHFLPKLRVMTIKVAHNHHNPSTPDDTEPAENPSYQALSAMVKNNLIKLESL